MRIEDRSDRLVPSADGVATSTSHPPLPPRSDLRADLPPRETPALLAFYAGLRAQVRTAGGASAIDGTGATRDAVVQSRLDALRDAYEGPYRVDGGLVPARPMFRLNHGANEDVMKQHQPQLDAIAKSVGVNGEMLRRGCAAPRDLVKVTQALIDAGKLPPAPGDAATRIRQMQWTSGIGVDCAGYTWRAVQAASGASQEQLGLGALGAETFRTLDSRSTFAKVPISEVRPGDVMTLDPQPGYRWGHNVIVRGHTIADDAAKHSLEARFGNLAATFLASAGPHHLIEVDSSWGAGAQGADYGGYRRDTWLYDESTKQWASVDPSTRPPALVVSADGPSSDVFHGAYRPKAGI